MFENIDNLFDLQVIGVGPIKTVVDCIEFFSGDRQPTDEQQTKVLHLSIAAAGMLKDLYKCVGRMDEQQGSSEKPENRRS